MKAITIRKFKDLKEGKTRQVGETFIVSKSRFREINSAGHGELIQEVDEGEKEK